MKTRLIPLFTALLSLMLPALAQAEKKFVLGVFLPTVVADGQKRFELGEQLARELEKGLGRPVTLRNFGRFEDFAQASRGGLDAAVVEAWAAAELKKGQVVAQGGVQGKAALSWALVSRNQVAVKNLAGKRLAVVRGVSALDSRFVTNVIFGGDLDAARHFKLVSVPNVESALAAVEAKTAEAALVPALQAPAGLKVIYRSSAVPAVVALSFRGKRQEQDSAWTQVGAITPLTAFKAAEQGEVDKLQHLIVRGPPKRIPALAETPTLRPDPFVIVNVDEVKPVLPSFVEFIASPTEQPND